MSFLDGPEEPSTGTVDPLFGAIHAAMTTLIDNDELVLVRGTSTDSLVEALVKEIVEPSRERALDIISAALLELDIVEELFADEVRVRTVLDEAFG
ncbi:MAG: hypothetical protein K0V04_46290 [Deltaproteobacteria bacterium]|nr:hypothetical protein [Deltaproteobacteria bacterium]